MLLPWTKRKKSDLDNARLIQLGRNGRDTWVYWKPKMVCQSRVRNSRGKETRLLLEYFVAERAMTGEENFLANAAKYLAMDAPGGKMAREMRARAISNLESSRPPSSRILTLPT